MNIEKAEVTGDSKEGIVQTVVNYTNSKITVTNTNINANSDENEAYGINNWTDVTMSITNTNINVDSKKKDAHGIYNEAGEGSTATITNTQINVNSDENNAYGIENGTGATMSITNTNVFADASSGHVAEVYSIGISNSGEMRFYSGSVYGVHSGLQNNAGAKLYVYGGTFDGYVHGGIYFAQGENGEAYVENATLQSGPYKGKHGESVGDGNWGCLYIGGGSKANDSNNKVYMDRCTLLSAGLVLRGSAGETNNQLYISNSTMESGKTARIDENQKLFVGKGTNITTANVSSADRVEFTNEEYKR